MLESKYVVGKVLVTDVVILLTNITAARNNLKKLKLTYRLSGIGYIE